MRIRRLSRTCRYEKIEPVQESSTGFFCLKTSEKDILTIFFIKTIDFKEKYD